MILYYRYQVETILLKVTNMSKYYIKSKGNLTASRRKAICQGLDMNLTRFKTSRMFYEVTDSYDSATCGFRQFRVTYMENGKQRNDVEIIMYSATNDFDSAVTDRFNAAIAARKKAIDEAIELFVSLLP